jgi:GNAT superfamily N-acetyltransferase
MASIIFRLYLVNNKAVYLCVIGDISLDASLRGKGLGRWLLAYIRQYVGQNLPGRPAFVIPNEAAHKSLISAGWEIGGKLVSYVLPLAPTEELSLALGNRFLAKHIAWLINKFMSIIAQLHIRNGYSLQWVSELDSSFATLWNAIPKENLILSDRGIEHLTWRYLHHPRNKFHIVKFLKRDELVGYLIYTLSQSDNVCHIYDLIVREQKDLLCMFSLFQIQSIRHGSLSMIKLVLNDKHPYRKTLWKLGFIPRSEQGTFDVFWPTGFAQKDSLNWSITLGDKDV